MTRNRKRRRLEQCCVLVISQQHVGNRVPGKESLVGEIAQEVIRQIAIQTPTAIINAGCNRMATFDDSCGVAKIPHGLKASLVGVYSSTHARVAGHAHAGPSARSIGKVGEDTGQSNCVNRTLWGGNTELICRCIQLPNAELVHNMGSKRDGMTYLPVSAFLVEEGTSI